MTLQHASPVNRPQNERRTAPMRGIVLMAAGMFLFAAVDTHAKYLTASLHPIQITWSRQLGLLLGVFIIVAIKGAGVLRSSHPWLQVSRGVMAACSATIFIVAVSYVPLADAIAVTFVAPFIVTVLGALILREKVGIRRWTAVLIGFAGTLVVIRPGLGVFHPAMFLVLIAAAAFALRQILSRFLSGGDPVVTTVAYTAIVSVALLSIPLPFVWKTPIWGLEVLLLVSMALIAACAETLVIMALEAAETVVVAPVHYTILIWGTFYGWMVFGQLPDFWTWIGAAIIVATGIYTLNRERLVAKGRATEA